MFLLCLKRILTLFSLSFFCFVFSGFSEEAEKPATRLSVDLKCVQDLREKYLKETEKGAYLSIKEGCEKNKDEATECCSNPRNCSGLIMDITQNVGPLLPALYGAYKGYKTSGEAYSDKITREQAIVKMCDVKNKVAMSGYLSQLLAQMAPLLEKTCGDKIARCKKQCNDLIDGFKDDFKLCFSKVAFEGSNGSVNDIIDFAKKCEEIESISNSKISTLTDAKAFPIHCAVQKDAGEDEDVTAITFLPTDAIPNGVKSYVTKETIGYILLFAKAYTFSSAIKKKEESMGLSENSTELSENSNESEIVKCSYQPDRVVTQGKKPGAPVPPPMIDICQRAVDGIINDNPYPPMPPVPPSLPPSDSPNPHTGTFTGGDLQKSGGVFYRDPNEEYGVVPEPSGELPDLVNKPGLQKNLPGWAGGSPSGGSGSGASGGVGGGGGPAGGSRSPSKGDFGFPYARTGANGNIAGAFSGSDHYPNVVGSSGTTPPYRRSAGGKSKGKEKNLKEKNKKDKIDSNGSNIFQMASQRIQEFCSGYSCMK